MPLQPKTYGKSSERACGDAAAGRDVPISALDLPFFFDTMENKNEIENLEGEIWKPVVGFEGLYEVSNLGRVKSLKYRGHEGVHKIMKPLKKHGGYLSIGLSNNYNKKTKQIHRLVYEAFVARVPKYSPSLKSGNEIYEINHIDEDKTNNCVWNLELVTHTKNVNHGTGIQRRCESQKNKRNSKKVYQYTKNGELVRIFPSVMECNRNGFEKRNIDACCSGKRKTHKGFVWSRKPLNNN